MKRNVYRETIIEGRLIGVPKDINGLCLLHIYVNRQSGYNRKEAFIRATGMLAKACFMTLERGELVQIQGELEEDTIMAKKILSLTKRGG